MNVIFFHVGRNGLPEYQEDHFKQFRLFNPDIPTYYLTQKQFMKSPLFAKYNIVSLDINDYYSKYISHFVTFFHYGVLPDAYQFWVVAATRLMYIENAMRVLGLRNVYHYENDVLIYYDIKTLHNKFHSLYPTMAITVGGPDKCITGFMYINNPKPLGHMTKWFVDSLRTYNKKTLQIMYGMDMVNEMTLMRAFSREFPDELQFLPILPFGEWSNNYTEFGSLFDPASYGQFVGGNVQEKQPGLMPDDHYIGKLLQANPDYTVVWKEDKLGRKIPYFKFDGQEVKINNLHIHSKNLHLYQSK